MNHEVFVQIAGICIHSLEYRSYLSTRYSNFKSILLANDSLEIMENSRTYRVKFPSFCLKYRYLRFVILLFLLRKHTCKVIRKNWNIHYFVEEWLPGTIVLTTLPFHKVELDYFKVDYLYYPSTLIRNIARKIMYFFETILIKRSQRVFVFNEGIKEGVLKTFSKKIPLLKNKLFVLYPRIEVAPLGAKSRTDFIFLGKLRLDQKIGEILHFIDFLVHSRQESVILHIFGEFVSHVYETQMHDLVRLLNIEENVRFYGFRSLDDPELVEAAIHSSLGFATFDTQASRHTFYAWPSKIMFYFKYSIPFFYLEGSSTMEKDLITSGLALCIEKFDFDKMAAIIHDRDLSASSSLNINFLNSKDIAHYF